MWTSEDGRAEEGDHTEVKDLDAQFAQQHQAMDQMRQMLAARDQQQAARVRQAQAYATRLSEIKSRAIASKRSVSSEASGTEQRDEGTGKKVCEADVSLELDQEKELEKQSSFSRKSDKFRHGNLSLLRKQMEENRIKFEQRGKEMTENKRGIEEMLTQLKRQLDERDQIIKGLQQKNDANTQFDSSFESADGVLQCVSEPSPASEEYQHVQDMLAGKDTTIMQLNARVEELEASVFELEENLREKDSVIEARTKAIALLSEDLGKRSKTTLDTLDETRQQMRLMQQNFVALEVQMKEEKDQLNTKIEAKDKRLAECQESIALLETARYNLSTRNAALQEKVVRLQELSAELHTQHDMATQRAEELAASLNETNKQTIRTKAQYSNKVKALRKQIDELNKVTDVNEEISKLQNRIAELEEEKGNLQLHLVDFDELKVSETNQKQRIAELEERTLQSSKDLDSHVHIISLLETEKLDLLQSEQAQKQHISSLASENAELKDNLSSLENQKVMLEMKAVELEEQMDMLSKERTELKAEVTSVRQQLSSAVQGRDEKFEIMELTRASDAGNVETEESNNSVGKNEKDSSNLEVVLRSLESELGGARRAVEEQKGVISDLNAKLDSKEEELELQQEMIFKLEQLTAIDNRAKEEDGNQITDILKDVGDMAADLEEWKTRCTEVEDRLKALEMEKTDLETRFEEVRNENRMLSMTLQNQKNTADQLMDKLKEQNEGIYVRDANILKLQTLINENRNVLKERESALQEVHSILDEVQENFKNRYAELELRFKEKQIELEFQKSSMLDTQTILASKDSELQYLKTELNKRQHQLDKLLDENKIVKQNIELHFQEKIQELSEQVKQMNIANQQMIQNINDMKNDILDKNKYIEKLEVGIKNSEEVEKQLEIATDAMNKISYDLDNVKQELNMKCVECSEVTSKLNEAEEQNKEKTEKMKRLTANLKGKALALRGSEDKVKQLEAAIEVKESALSELNAMLKDKSEELLQMKFQVEEQAGMLHAKEGEIFMLAQKISELEQMVEKLDHRKVHGEENSTLAQNEIIALKTELDDRGSEIELLRAEQVELLRKCSDAEYKSNELLSKINELEQRNKIMVKNKSQNWEHVAELEDKMVAKDLKYVEAMGKVEGLQDVISEQQLLYSGNVETSKRGGASFDSQRDMDVIGRDMKIVELEEQISSIQERYQQTWAALEAKLQEREAVVESLELDLSRSQERVQSLENTASEMGDRQNLLESSAMALEQQLEEARRRLQEEDERRQLTEVELARLVGIEASSRQEIEGLLEKKVELENSLKDMTAERSEMLKRIANLEMNFREMSNEMERLSEFESAFNEESMRVQALMMQLRQQALEMEGKSRDLEESRQYCESLESDLKTCREQLEELEAERRNLIEREEMLHSKLIQVEENLTSASDEWEGKLNEQNNQIMQLRKEKEKLFDSLESKMESLQHDTGEIIECDYDYQKQISALNVQVSDLKDVIVQKEEEMRTYQTRLLQLQFGNQGQQLAGNGENTSQNKILELETTNAELHSRVAQYDKNIFDLQEQLSQARVDLEGAYLRLSHYAEETQLLTEKVSVLQGELNEKNIELQELFDKHQGITNDISNDSMHIECENKLSELQQERDLLLKQLLCEKATSEVQNIIMLAEERVRNVGSLHDESLTQGGDVLDRSVALEHVSVVDSESSPLPFVHFEECTSVFQPEELVMQKELTTAVADDLLWYNMRIQELEAQVLKLQHDFSVIETERNNAMMRIKELEVHSKESEKFASAINQQVPVVEEVCVQKSAYLTYQPVELNSLVCQDPSSTNSTTAASAQPNEFHNITFFQDQPGSPFNVEMEPVALEDESWGWGTDEARLEEEHLKQKQQASAPVVDSDERLVSLEKELHTLVVEKKALEEEVKATQFRCDKLLHKLKEIKIKNDNLMKENLELSKRNSSVSGFGDLDSAIEEEFKIRIDSLEKSMRELTAELDTARLEREGLLIQIEVLTSANSKILEVKEKQDLDLDFCQKRYKELSNAKEAIDWMVEELTEENKILSSKIREMELELNGLRGEGMVTSTQENIQGRIQMELQEQLATLAADNEHLQSLLEEQRSMRLRVESDLSRQVGNFIVGQIECGKGTNLENTGSPVDFRHEKESMVQEIDNLFHECATVQSAYEVLKASNEVSDTKSKENSLETKTCNRCNSLQKQYEDVIESLTKEISMVGKQFDATIIKNTELFKQLERVQRSLEEVYEKCEKMATKWLCDRIIIEEETLDILQIRDELKAVVEIVVGKAENILTLPASEDAEPVIMHLRDDLVKNTVDVESMTEAMNFKNEEIKKLRDSIAAKDETVLQLEEHVRYLNAQVGGIYVQSKNVDEKMGSQSEQLLLEREEELSKLKQELLNKEREVECLRQELTQIEERTLVKDEDIQSLRVQLVEKSQKLEYVVEAKEEDVHKLQEQLGEVAKARESDVRELRLQLEDVTEAKKRDEHELQQLQEEAQALREQLSAPLDSKGNEQSELDLALYMLHQRDVRCDELTLELMQLLEERDTLQLRLSNALRANEDLRSKAKSLASSAVSTGEGPDAAENLVGQDQVIGKSTVEESDENFQELNTKLSQLHSVGYRRDITFQDEQEHRHSTQMKLLQRQGSSIVVDANYTLSRDVQPQSTVLLNWIRGRSTPRVMHV